MMKCLAIVILFILCSCSKNATRLVKYEPVRSVFFPGKELEFDDTIPFIFKIPDNQTAKLYTSGYTAIKILSVIVDGKEVFPADKEIMLDDIDTRVRPPEGGAQVYLMHSSYLLTLDELSSMSYNAVLYSLPKKYSKAEIKYDIRNENGLSAVENTLTLINQE